MLNLDFLIIINGKILMKNLRILIVKIIIFLILLELQKVVNNYKEILYLIMDFKENKLLSNLMQMQNDYQKHINIKIYYLNK